MSKVDLTHATPEERVRAERNRKHPTPYQRIVKAACAGRGMRLSAEEVRRLDMDDAITTRALRDDCGET